ncbi:hypothetical protein INT46_010785 [Mucor plumbeus]|uniref:Uncharacterized protein n=1 Tax=Mucor plumbeus TaxID=97098 RepID=A0A8H7UX05_9FUNG|nr:hypothetical protein INT46_010785 [Mucor plumbeus]
MPFRCKCGRTFEKIESFGTHTSSCAPFHHRRISTSDILVSKNEIKVNEKAKLTIETDYFSQQTNNQQKKKEDRLSFFPLFSSNKRENELELTPQSAPVSGFMMPTALSIQSTFEGVSRRRSMSYNKTAPFN